MRQKAVELADPQTLAHCFRLDRGGSGSLRKDVVIIP